MIIGIATGILLLVSVLMLAGELRQQRIQKADSEEIELQSQLLESKIVDLEDQIVQIENERPESRGTAEVIFPDPDEKVYSEIYPLMQENGYAGMLAIPVDYVLGEEGNLNAEQLRELAKAGWGICCYWEADAKAGQYDSWKAKMQEEALPVERVIYFARDVYPPESMADLKESDVQVCVHHGEEGPLVTEELPEGIWEIGAIGIQGSQPRLYLEQAVSNKGNIAYTVSYDDEEEMFETDVFQSMLTYFQNYEEEGNLVVLTVKEALDYRREAVDKEEQWSKENETRIEELEAQIEELKNEIETVRRNQN